MEKKISKKAQNIKKDVYHERKLGKKQLTITSIALIAISVLILTCGIIFIVVGAKSTETVKIVVKCVIGGLLTLLSLAGLTYGIVAFFITRSMIDTDGNVKDSNRAIGTVNVLKCDKCGKTLKEDALFCDKCGTKVDDDAKICECGNTLKSDEQYCDKCGKEIKK